MTEAEAVKCTNIIDRDLLWSDLMKIAEFTEPGKPYTRRSFTELHCQAREWLSERLTDAGLSVRTDATGNLIGRIHGKEPERGTIMIGSHCDTVLGGGRFDGVAGIIAGMEIARAINRRAIKLRHNLEVVDFLAEEPNPWGLSCVGSRGISGQLEVPMLAYTAPGGETLAQAITRVGGNPEEIPNNRRNDIRAFFELHIEQGPILEAEGIDLGLVTAIVGITRLEMTFKGEADHAGTTPLNLRRDAGTCAAEMMVYVRRLAEELFANEEGYFVATTGICEVLPGAINVVPEMARIVVDARSESRALMERFIAEVDAMAAATAERLRVDFDGLNILSDTWPAVCNRKLKALLKSCADDLGYSSMELASGAGHDAAFISRVGPAAMLFVPCLKGKSHSAAEWAEPQALADGAGVIAEAIIRWDAQVE